MPLAHLLKITINGDARPDTAANFQLEHIKSMHFRHGDPPLRPPSPHCAASYPMAAERGRPATQNFRFKQYTPKPDRATRQLASSSGGDDQRLVFGNADKQFDNGSRYVSAKSCFHIGCGMCLNYATIGDSADRFFVANWSAQPQPRVRWKYQQHPE